MFPPSAADLENLWRFARLQTTSDLAAEELVQDVLKKNLQNLETEDVQEQKFGLFSEIWDRHEDSTLSSTGLPQFLTGLTPVQRAGVTLHYLESFLSTEIEEICGLTSAELKEVLTRCPTDEEARTALASLTPGGEISAHLTDFAEKTTKSTFTNFRLWSPVGLALLVAVGVLVWTLLGHREIENLPLGRELLQRAETIAGENLEPVDVPAGDLADWLFLKHGLDNVHVPVAFAPLQAAFCGVSRVEDHPVAEIAFKESRTLLFLFQAADFELTDGSPGKWDFFSQDDWTGAFQVEKGEARVIARRGNEEELRKFLDGLK